MLKLIKLLEKNFKLVWSSKVFVLMVLLGPLLMAILLGLAFNNTKPYAIKVGVYSDSYNDELKDKILGRLNENFEVSKFPGQEDCLKALKDASTQVCLGLPSSITKEGNEASEIVFYVDNSRVNLVWMILDSLSDILEKSSAEISLELTNELLFKLEMVKERSLQLKNLTDVAKEQSNTSWSKAGEIGSNIGALDLEKTQKKVEEAVSKNLETEKQLELLRKSLDESLVFLAKVEGNVSGLSQAQDKLEEAKKKANLPLAEMGSLLGEVDKGVFSTKEVVLTSLTKNTEVRNLISSSLGNLGQIAKITEEISREIKNTQVTNASKIVRPIITEIRQINSSGTYFTFIYPALIVLIIVFTSMLLASSVVVKEKKSLSFFRNYLSGTSEIIFLLAYWITDLILVMASLLIFVVFSKLAFQAPMNLTLFLVLFLLTSLFTLLGSLLGYLANSEQSSLLLSLTLASAMVFFSDLIIPVEGVSGVLRKVVEYNPFFIGETILRKTLIYEMEIGLLMNDLLWLLIYILILGSAIFLFLKFIYRRNFKLRGRFRKV